MRTRLAAAALAASLLLVSSGTAGAASSGMVPMGQVARVSLDHAVAVVAAGTTPGTGAVSVAEGATGFPVSVSTDGATGGTGSVPPGDCLDLEVHGHEVATGQAGEHGRFAIAGAVPAGAVATIRWAPCGGSDEADQTGCHNSIPHQHNPNRDEARSAGQGCSSAGDAGPRS